MIYHVLTESEPFSQTRGGAISRWVGNVLSGDVEAAIVCPSFDASWSPGDRNIFVIDELKWYRRAMKSTRRRLPLNLRLWLSRRAFSTFCKNVHDADLIYVHNRPEYAVALRSLLSGKHVPIILHLHNSHLSNASQTLRTMVTRDVTLTVFCSAFLQLEAASAIPSLTSTALVANGADHNLFYPRVIQRQQESEILQVLYVGRLVRDKGAHVFLKALDLLSKSGVAVKGTVVGSANFGNDCQTDYTRSLRSIAPRNVEFITYSSGEALANRYREADVFCCPSLWNDPFPLVVLEAMASGLAIVASRVGGIPEMFTEPAAILVQPGDAAQLARAIKSLSESPELRYKLASKAHQEYSRRFKWSNVRTQYEKAISLAESRFKGT